MQETLNKISSQEQEQYTKELSILLIGVLLAHSPQEREKLSKTFQTHLLPEWAGTLVKELFAGNRGPVTEWLRKRQVVFSNGRNTEDAIVNAIELHNIEKHIKHLHNSLHGAVVQEKKDAALYEKIAEITKAIQACYEKVEAHNKEIYG